MNFLLQENLSRKNKALSNFFDIRFNWKKNKKSGILKEKDKTEKERKVWYERTVVENSTLSFPTFL